MSKVSSPSRVRTAQDRVLPGLAGLSGLCLCAAGAAGAHILSGGGQEVWRPPSSQWDSALLFGFVHTLAALAAGRAGGGAALAARSLFLAGTALFSLLQLASLAAATLTAAQTGLAERPGIALDGVSFLIPVGGLCFMAGWTAIIVSSMAGAGADRRTDGSGGVS